MQSAQRKCAVWRVRRYNHSYVLTLGKTVLFSHIFNSLIYATHVKNTFSSGKNCGVCVIDVLVYLPKCLFTGRCSKGFFFFFS